MPVSMSRLTVPAFEQGLEAMSQVLDKAEKHAAARKIDEAALLQARLFPDMYPMVRQVQIASDFAKGAAARLSGAESPRYADEETSFAALKERIAKTLAYVRSVPAESIDGSEKRTISLGAGSQTLTFEGEAYVLRFVLPNFYFHLATAYDILRHSGVEIGKRDFVGAFQ